MLRLPNDSYASAFIELLGRASVQPGESFEAYLTFLPYVMARYGQEIAVGAQFELCEGPHYRVIIGEVLEIL